MNENLQALLDDGGLTLDEIVQLVRNSFLVSWISPERREYYLNLLDTHVGASA